MATYYENDGTASSDGGFDWGGVGQAALDIGKTVFSIAQTGIQAAAPYVALAASITQAEAQKAAAYYQQGLYEVQAIDTLRLAQIRSDQDRKYAAIQAGRKLKAAEMTAMNYTIQGNTLLRGMERANAAVRARAAANGVAYSEGSAAAVQRANVAATYRDVGVSNLNALTARVLGYEDASAMFLAAEQQADYNLAAAETQARQLQIAGDFAVKSGGLLSGATLLQGGVQFAQTVRNPFGD